MQKKQYIGLITLLLSFFLGFLILNQEISYDRLSNSPKTSFDAHEAIYIDEFTSISIGTNGIVTGTGSDSNPWVIAGWLFEDSSETSIKIKNRNDFFQIQECRFENIVGGVYCENLEGISIINCELCRETISSGPYVYQSGIELLNVGNIRVVYNTMSGYSDQLVLYECSKFNVSYNSFKGDNYNYGGILVESEYTSDEFGYILENSFSEFTHTAICTTQSSNLSVTNNHFKRNLQCGQLWECENFTFNNNTFSDNVKGFQFTNSNHISFYDNHFYNNADEGLYLKDNTNDFWINNNHFEDFKYSVIVILSSSININIFTNYFTEIHHDSVIKNYSVVNIYDNIYGPGSIDPNSPTGEDETEKQVENNFTQILNSIPGYSIKFLIFCSIFIFMVLRYTLFKKNIHFSESH